MNPSGASSIERTTRRSGRLVVFLYTRGSIYTCSTVERLNTWRTLTDEIVCNLGRVWPAPPTFLPSQSRGSFSDVGRKRGLRVPLAPPLPPLILFRPRDHVNPEIPRGDGGRPSPPRSTAEEYAERPARLRIACKVSSIKDEKNGAPCQQQPPPVLRGRLFGGSKRKRLLPGAKRSIWKSVGRLYVRGGGIMCISARTAVIEDRLSDDGARSEREVARLIDNTRNNERSRAISRRCRYRKVIRRQIRFIPEQRYLSPR